MIKLSGKIKDNKFLSYNSKDLNKSIDFLEVLLLYHIEKLDFEEGPKGFLSTPDPEFVKKYDRSAVAIRQLEQLREISAYPSKAKEKILPAKKNTAIKKLEKIFSEEFSPLQQQAFGKTFNKAIKTLQKYH